MEILWGLFLKQTLIVSASLKCSRGLFFFCLKYTEGNGIFLVLIVYQSTRSNIEFSQQLCGEWIWLTLRLGEGQRLLRALRGWGQSPDINPADTHCKAQAFHVGDLHVEVPWWLPGSGRSSSPFSQSQEQWNIEWIRYQGTWVLFHPLPAGGWGQDRESLCP